MELEEALALPTIFWAIAAATQDDNHRVLCLQLGEFPTLSRVVSEFVVGKDLPGTMSSRIMNSSEQFP